VLGHTARNVRRVAGSKWRCRVARNDSKPRDVNARIGCHTRGDLLTGGGSGGERVKRESRESHGRKSSTDNGDHASSRPRIRFTPRAGSHFLLQYHPDLRPFASSPVARNQPTHPKYSDHIQPTARRERQVSDDWYQHLETELQTGERESGVAHGERDVQVFVVGAGRIVLRVTIKEGVLGSHRFDGIKGLVGLQEPGPNGTQVLSVV
jgi:hypothetical protein